MNESEARQLYGRDLVDRAMFRKVTWTQYGWRVEYDESLDGDYERDNHPDKPRAYWPKENCGEWRCRCRWGRTKRMCSHILAVLLTGEAG